MMFKGWTIRVAHVIFIYKYINKKKRAPLNLQGNWAYSV